MLDMTQLAPRLQVFFTQTAEAVARQTKFVQRASKMTGALFLQSFVFGFEDLPQASLTDLIETSDDLGVVITKQGVQDRITDAVPFLRAMFEQSLRLFRHVLPLELAVLKQFSGLFITDSTVLALPESQRTEFPGCGGSGSEAALKIQLTFDLLTGSLDTVDFQPGRSADQGYEGHVQQIRPGALYLSDLGYFVLRHFQQIAQVPAYFLSRLDLKTTIFDPASGDRLDLLAWLRTQTDPTVETHWLVGAEEKLPCRVLVTKLPPEVADRRRQKAREAARRKGRTLFATPLGIVGLEYLPYQCARQPADLAPSVGDVRGALANRVDFQGLEEPAGPRPCGGPPPRTHPDRNLCQVDRGRGHSISDRALPHGRP